MKNWPIRLLRLGDLDILSFPMEVPDKTGCGKISTVIFKQF
jgi:hypothetical protein